MLRTLQNPNDWDGYLTKLPLNIGGLGVETSQEALTILNSLASSAVGDSTGPVPITPEDTIDLSYFGNAMVGIESADGDSLMLINETKEWFLTAYDVFSSYTVTTNYGTVYRKDNVIYYTAPSTSGAYGFLVNGTPVSITVKDPAEPDPVIGTIAKTSIVSPVTINDITAGNVSFQTAAFSITLTSGFDEHHSTDWEIATDLSFINITRLNSASLTDLTSWTATGLPKGVNLYVRARHRGYSVSPGEWSNTVVFNIADYIEPLGTVKKAVLVTPINVVDQDHGSVIIETEPFSITLTQGSDFHYSTDWQIANDANFTDIVIASTNDHDNLLTWATTSLYVDNVYYVRARHRAETIGPGAWSDLAIFELASWPVFSTTRVEPTQAIYPLSRSYGSSIDISDQATIFVTINDDELLAYWYDYHQGFYLSQPGTIASSNSIGYYNEIVIINADAQPTEAKVIIASAAYESSPGQYSRRISLLITDATGIFSLRSGIDVPGLDATGLAINKAGTVVAVQTDGAVLLYDIVGNTLILKQTIASTKPGFGQTITFGHDGNWLAISEYSDGDTTDYYKVHLYMLSGESYNWSQSLQPIDHEKNDMFGFSVSFNPDSTLIAIGAYRSEGSYGSTYVFQKTGLAWVQQAKLTAEVPKSDRYFGYYVKFSGNNRLLSIANNITSRSAYVYTFNGNAWISEKILAAYGNYHAYAGYTDCFLSREFRRIHYTAKEEHQVPFAETGKFVGDNSNYNLWRIGYSHALSDDGHYFFINGGARTTSETLVYVYRKTGFGSWVLDGKLLLPVPIFGSNSVYPSSISCNVDGTYVAVGVGNHTTALGTWSRGIVYCYKRKSSGWVFDQQVLPPSDGQLETAQRFGAKVAISADATTLVIGAPYWLNSATGVIVGAVHSYYRPGTNDTDIWSFNRTDTKDIAYGYFGTVLDLSSDGKMYATAGFNDNNTFIYGLTWADGLEPGYRASITTGSLPSGSPHFSGDGKWLILFNNLNYGYLYEVAGNTFTLRKTFNEPLQEGHLSHNGSLLTAMLRVVLPDYSVISKLCYYTKTLEDVWEGPFFVTESLTNRTFARSLSVSAMGNTILTNDFNDGSTGAAYIFE